MHTKAAKKIPTSTETFAINGQNYTVIRFPDGKGPTFAQSLDIAKKQGKELLTFEEARSIRDDNELSAAFLSALKVPKGDEWTRRYECTFVRDPGTEATGNGDIFNYYRGTGGREGRLDVDGNLEQDFVASMLILKETTGSNPGQAYTEGSVQKLPSTETFAINGQNYTVIRFPDGKGPTFAQSLDIAKKQGKELLTFEEAKAIEADTKSNIAFEKALKPRDWTHISDSGPEALGPNAELMYFHHMVSDSSVFRGSSQYNHAPVLVLKEIGNNILQSLSEAAVTKSVPTDQIPDAKSAHRDRQTTFSETKVNGTSVFILENRDMVYSMTLLADNGLRLLSHREALSIFSELRKQNKEKTYFFLIEGHGLGSRKGIYTFNENGEIRKPKGTETLDSLVYISSSPTDEYHLFLCFAHPEAASAHDARFSIFSINGSSFKSTYQLVGVKKTQTRSNSVPAQEISNQKPIAETKRPD